MSIFNPEPWFERYELVPDKNGREQFLGHGSFGNVYLGREKASGAHHRRVPSDDGLVALKFINSEKIRNAEELNRLYEEVRVHRIVSELDFSGREHSSRVLRLYSAHREVAQRDSSRSVESLTLVLAIELAGLPVVNDLCQRRDYCEEMVRAAVHQIATGLCVMHHNGIVHRDLKLDNILCATGRSGPSEQLLLCDMGLSFQVGRDMRAGEIGTLTYIPPESIKHRIGSQCSADMTDAFTCERCSQAECFSSLLPHSDVPYSDKTDVWALGGIIFTFLAGHSPFEAGENESPRFSTLRYRIWHGDVQWPPAYGGTATAWGQISARAKDVIRFMLNPDPSSRPSMQQVLSHPWFNEPAPTVPLDARVREGLAVISARAGRVRAARMFKATITYRPEAGRAANLCGILSGNSSIDASELTRAFQEAATSYSSRNLIGLSPQESGAIAGHSAQAHPEMAIDVAGLRAVLLKVGINSELVDELISTHRLFEALDVDRSGSVDWREFIALIPLLVGSSVPISSLPDATLALYFSLWDTNKDGKLQRDELVHMLIALNIGTPGGMSEVSLDPLFCAADNDSLDWIRLREILSQPSFARRTSVGSSNFPAATSTDSLGALSVSNPLTVPMSTTIFSLPRPSS
jgi:serine/threonine protein kinase